MGSPRPLIRPSTVDLLADDLRREILDGALVAAAGSPRIEAAHAALSGEMRLFLLQLQPHLPVDRLAADHRALVAGLEREGPSALREHLRAAAETLAEREEP